MKSETLSLPASVNFYMSSRANRNAIDLIIRKPDLPSDLQWDEVLAFHDAVSTAHRVQLDYFSLLYDVWQRTWGTAKKQLLPSAEQPVVSDLRELPPTPETIWNYGQIASKIGLQQSFAMWAGVDLSDMKELELSFYVDTGDDNYSLSDNLMLDPDWLPVDVDHYRSTVPGLCPIKAEAADPASLTNAAYQALDRVLRQLAKPIT